MSELRAALVADGPAAGLAAATRSVGENAKDNEQAIEQAGMQEWNNHPRSAGLRGSGGSEIRSCRASMAAGRTRPADADVGQPRS